MNPFFFGNSKAPLYGVFHQPDSASPKSHGAVLCAPLGQEYMRSHRAMRQLATMLSRIGIAVLRFDYRGTGDSAENLEDVTAEQWLEDCHTAIDELKDTAGVKSVSLIGLRLGGILATYASLSRKDITRIVLWDPALSGESYLEELKTEVKNQAIKKRTNFIDSDGTVHYNGFAITQSMQASLHDLNLLESYPSNVPSVIQLVSHDSDNFSKLNEAWSKNQGFEFNQIDAAGDWNYVDDNGGILLPQPIIQSIVNEYKLKEAA